MDVCVRRLYASTWTVWREAILYRVRIADLSRLAVCRWALCLQARIWAAWRRYLTGRRAKRVRELEMVTKHQESQRCQSLAAFLAAGLGLRARRQSLICCEIWKNDQRLFYLTLRLATKWRLLAFRRKHDPTLSARLPLTNPDLGLEISEYCKQKLSSGHWPNSLTYVKTPLSHPRPHIPDFLIPALLDRGLYEPLHEELTSRQKSEPDEPG
ncbi:unnamed protein product [Protopolystoma xenopodis]|uniref:Sfi1 spindle body domain-containing protein n=1 Tax=Protopolystoma xenopodis TaxID=117903 RepID=A0A3S5A4Q8_9PLAT|nr:unnamed protein product [Protopolystoma xenopodis]